MANAHEPRIARVAAMIADPARSRMLAYLLDGSYASASELAAAASITAQTASGHLSKLQSSGFVVCEPRGRHRYYKLADADAAHALEALAVVAERNSHDKVWASPMRQQLRYARCCYGHLAGTLGVALCDTLMQSKRLKPRDDNDVDVTQSGEAYLAAIGFVLDAAMCAGTRKLRLAYPCLDWSERRDHLAGRLSVSLLEHFISQGWLKRQTAHNSNRVLKLTLSGKRVLLPWLGLKEAQ
jgi:DNA-binding transcriptional ArsR family regulator